MQTSIWPHVQKQLLIQYLSIDLQLEIVNTFASGNCPEGWSSQTPSCYRYENGWVNFGSSIDACTKLHGLSHPVVVNHGEEQRFLEEIGLLQACIGRAKIVTADKPCNLNPPFNELTPGRAAGLKNLGQRPNQVIAIENTSSDGQLCMRTYPPGSESTYLIRDGWMVASLLHQLDKGEGQEGCGWPTLVTVASGIPRSVIMTLQVSCVRFHKLAGPVVVIPKHALITLLRNSPQDDLNGLILQIGPDATEILLKNILSPLFIESVINSTFSNVTFELCSESFLAAITPLVTTDQLVEICMFDPVAFWERQRAYWKFPEIEKKFLDIVSVSITDPRDIDPSVLELASFNSLILKQIEYQDAIASSLMVPFDPATLSQDVDVTGTPEEWAAVFERLGNYLNMQMLQHNLQIRFVSIRAGMFPLIVCHCCTEVMWNGVPSPTSVFKDVVRCRGIHSRRGIHFGMGTSNSGPGSRNGSEFTPLPQSGNRDGLFGELLSDPSVQQQFAIQEVTNLLVEASNAVYDLVEDLSVGNIAAKGPETVKFLSGVQLMLKQSRDIQTAIMETMLDPVKSSQYYSALASDNLFCNPTARSALLTLSVQSQKAFDDYICAVDYGVLAQELAVLLQVPQIDYLITYYIIDSAASELFPIPDQQYTQELWEEFIVNLMNIDEVMQQFIVTYNLTFVDGLPTMPLNMNFTSVMDNLAELGPLLTSLGLDEEIIILVEYIINITVPWDANSANRLLESMDNIFQLAGNSTLLEPILSNMLTNDLVTVTLRDIFRAITGKVYVFPDDLGSATSPDDIEKLIPLVYSLPDVVQVILGVLSDEQKVMQLFSSPDVRSIFCSDTSLDFLNSSFSAGVDLAGLQSVMCDVDFLAIAAEASSLPAVQNLYGLGNLSVSSGFNFTAYNIHQEELNRAIQDFIQTPIEIEVSQLWLNDTKADLLQVLIKYNSYQTDPARLQDLESLLQYLNELMMEDMANVTWAEDVRMAVQTVIASLSYANDILKVLPGQNVTFADILPPNLAEYVSNSIYYGVDINVLQLQALVNQEQLLAMAMGGDVLGAICGNVSSLDSLLVVPPEVNLTAAHVVLCSFNETAIGIEVMREVGKIVEKVETDIAESMAVVEEFIENIITLSQVPPDFIRFDEEWIHSNALKWEAVFISLEATYNKTLQENMNDFGMEMLFNFLQEALKDDPGFQSWLIQIRLEDYIVSILIETLTDLQGKNISYETLDESLQGMPTLQEALTFREVIPEMVDVLLSLSSDQEKSTQFFSSPNPFATACTSGTFQYFFEVPENSTTDVAALETRICGLNQSALFMELDRYLGISQIQNEIASILADNSSLPPVDFTAVFLRDAQLEALIEELVRNPPAITIDEELWLQTRIELNAVLALWQKEMNNLMNPATAIGDISSLLGMIEGQLANFENETWYEEMTLTLLDWRRFLEHYLHQSLLALSDVAPTLWMHSNSLLQTDKFTRILYNNASSGPYNWTASYLLSQKVNAAVAGLITNPPIIGVDSIWWTETVTELEAVLQQWSSLVNGNGIPISGLNMTTADDLAGLIRSIEEQLAIYQNETWYLEMTSSLQAMDLINQIVIDWANRLEGQTLTLPTLDEVFGNTTYVKQLLRLSSIAPDIVEAFLSLTLEEEKWNDFWAAENPIANACASGDFEGFFQLSPDSTSNITAVAAALCSVNLTAVDKELNELFMLNDTFTQLALIIYNQQRAVGPYNWTASYQLSLEVQDAINDLILNPPNFVADPTWLNQTRSDLLAVIESWWNAFSEQTGNPDPVSQFVGIFDMIESSVLPSISNTSWYQGVVQQMRIMDEVNQIILHWTRELKGWYVKMMYHGCNVKWFYGLSSGRGAFFEMDQPLLTVCKNGSIAEYFDLPPDSNVDVSVVQSALCSVNLTAVEIELSHLINLDAIILRVR
ncbi:hypothetical protein BSL78_27317 [Apostichopus japonicus]|uniref:C-type lectin domain-containing protein n=1 Tax=Stichopus japonicus TaxID=307972 RepID=A0A2G8JJD1_STIJA|nr:hypothetical protein BSL78_27317 [Apostichopus japonicus]